MDAGAHTRARVGAWSRYYNDLYELDLEALKWTPLGKPGDPVPPARSGCQMVRKRQGSAHVAQSDAETQTGDAQPAAAMGGRRAA